jgi:hypothetical protein
MHASYRSTAPHSVPTVSRLPSCFHERQVTVYMFSTVLTPVGCQEFSCALSEKVRKRLNEPTTTVSPEGLKAAAVNSFSPSSRE